MHVKSHAPAEQIAVAFAGGEQGMHEAPHDETLVLSAHSAPHTWNPALQAKPHAVPLQVAVPFAGAEHGEQAIVPQLFTLLLLEHAPAHTW